MEEKELVIKSEDKGDLISKTKTIYEAGPLEIFWKNFLAGFSRGLGGVFVYIIFLLVISGIFYNFVLPKFMPAITEYMNIFKSIGSISNTKSGPVNIIPKNFDILKIFGQ
jgi:hypothetical protein